MDEQRLATAIRDKILGAVERTIHLTHLVPKTQLQWGPPPSASPNPPMNLGYLLGHLLDCVAGFCAVLYAAHPAELQDFERLRALEVNHSCAPDDAAHRLEHYSSCILKGFEFLSDEDLSHEIPTAFALDGEPLITLLLGNFEHLINHKYQLFFYLKLRGVPVTSEDLYRFRGNLES
jgi:hypothetical protein